MISKNTQVTILNVRKWTDISQLWCKSKSVGLTHRCPWVRTAARPYLIYFNTGVCWFKISGDKITFLKLVATVWNHLYDLKKHRCFGFHSKQYILLSIFWFSLSSAQKTNGGIARVFVPKSLYYKYIFIKTQNEF